MRWMVALMRAILADDFLPDCLAALPIQGEQNELVYFVGFSCWLWLPWPTGHGIRFGCLDLPPGWNPVIPANGAVDRVGNGGFSRNVVVDSSGSYGINLAGSFPGKLEVQVDGIQVFSGHSIFEGNPYLTNLLTNVNLIAGVHTITVNYDAPLLTPGADGPSRFGPIYLSTQVAGDAKVRVVKAKDIPNLCKQNLDWIAIAR